MKLRTSGRSYVMTKRAQSAAATAERILDAAAAEFEAGTAIAGITLEAVAARAGVSVQTVLRRFGDKDKLFSATAERQAARVAAERDTAVPGDLEGAIANLAAHYERDGRLALRLLAEEASSPFMTTVTGAGRAYHRSWCGQVFGPFLDGLHGDERNRRLAQFVAVCDVYVWKLLRQDAGLGREAYIQAILELLEPLTRRT
ncbi:TetR/AcrR family transcriptional regulator [Arthrobacter sp. NQ7]|uniref:TetR/AcrR family transcriptional regulator n=1 Tax=Arthrobacter sp. NQ7 TaxID=3032303 RepID=UPI0024100564|nr:TetR/AcrR family transcriptional regulator [Arthrobacter sp. NQ7]MDJ0457060.1 TetR/AcrR family transcriptional regulator [Arthrobacter sp. NQ7]